jgi:hypothetical protein
MEVAVFCEVPFSVCGNMETWRHEDKDIGTYTVITARTVYQFCLEVALFDSELSGFFPINCFPDLERNISIS